MSAEKHLTLRERIRDELVRMIVSGELPAGAAIDEKKLVERLSTSRTPFREAIGTLEREGLIEIRPYRGFFVRQLSRKDVEDLYDLRETLEAMAAKRAVERASDSDTDRLSSILDRAVQALRADDMAAYAAEDRRFHEFIAELSDNHALVDTLSRLALQIQMCRVIANRSRDFAERAAAERDRILGAFRQRDAALAARLMAEHIADVRQSVMAQLMAEAG